MEDETTRLQSVVNSLIKVAKDYIGHEYNIGKVDFDLTRDVLKALETEYKEEDIVKAINYNEEAIKGLVTKIGGYISEQPITLFICYMIIFRSIKTRKLWPLERDLQEEMYHLLGYSTRR
jgi:hypothetical protein